MRHEIDCACELQSTSDNLPAINIGSPRRDFAPDMAITDNGDNDTPVQSQLER